MRNRGGRGWNNSDFWRRLRWGKLYYKKFAFDGNKQVKHGSNKETDRHSEDPLLQCSQGTLLRVLSWSIKYCNRRGRSSAAEWDCVHLLCVKRQSAKALLGDCSHCDLNTCAKIPVRQLARRQCLVLNTYTWSQSKGWNTHFCHLPVVWPWRNIHLFLSCFFTGRLRAIISICRLFQGLNKIIHN